MKNKVLIIVGMHRSMTSLLAQWLHACGLPLGDDLYGATIGNKKGHYEDKDFLELHKYIMAQNGYNWKATETINLQITHYSESRAKKIVELKNALYEQWGWKEPRTCLFLDFWDSIIPYAKYLIVYRTYTEVVDSLIRREFKVDRKIAYLSEWYKQLHNYYRLNSKKETYLKMWINYNQHILNFIKKSDPEKYILFSSEELLTDSEKIWTKINNDWKFNLENRPIEQTFDPRLSHSKYYSLENLDENLIHKANSIQEKLKRYSYYKSI